MRHWPGLPGIAVLLLASMGAAAMPGTLSRDESLRAQPDAAAAAVTSVRAGTVVEILERSAGWYRVRHEGSEGWLRLYWVRTASPRARAPGQPLRDISAGADRLRAPQGQVVAGLGVRGMSEEDLAAAHFDAAQLARLEEIAQATPVDNAAFARDGQLEARSVDEIVVTPPPARRR
jgi:hypothetical protein